MTEASTEDRSLFSPQAAYRALRDARYRHPANAVAELIDNSIDANATFVQLMLEASMQIGEDRQRRSRLVRGVMITDNGHGMDETTLSRALQVGGRPDNSSLTSIGKYGMGLPTASVAYGKRVDVWTWQNGFDNAVHCYLDFDEIEQKGPYIPPVDSELVPPHWQKRLSDDIKNSDSGTLVLWTKIDRLFTRPNTLFNRVETEIGRIYRHFINDKELKIEMSQFLDEQTTPEEAPRLVRPNDPLFLMRNSATPEPWNGKPMFELWQGCPEKQFTIRPLGEDGKEVSVYVHYSIVTQAALGDQAENPGGLPHGRRALKNLGVSVVREYREILLDDTFIRDKSRTTEPTNRWWGCEIRFGSECDELFGIDHNKQMASMLSHVAHAIYSQDDYETSLPPDAEHPEEVEGNPDVIDIVHHIYNTTRAMLKAIDAMYVKRRLVSERKPRSDGKPVSLPKDEAAGAGTRADEVDAKEGKTSETMKEWKNTPDEEKEEALTEALEDVDFPNPETEAKRVVDSGLRYEFVPKDLPGHHIFHVENVRGTLVVQLNTKHALYKYLKFLEGTEASSEQSYCVRALYVLVLAWVRTVDQIENESRKKDIEQIAGTWGDHAEHVLEQLPPLSTPDDD